MNVLVQIRSIRDPRVVGVWFEDNGKLAYLFPERNTPDRIVTQAQLMSKPADFSWQDWFTQLASAEPFGTLFSVVEADSPHAALTGSGV